MAIYFVFENLSLDLDSSVKCGEKKRVPVLVLLSKSTAIGSLYLKNQMEGWYELKNKSYGSYPRVGWDFCLGCFTTSNFVKGNLWCFAWSVTLYTMHKAIAFSLVSMSLLSCYWYYKNNFYEMTAPKFGGVFSPYNLCSCAVKCTVKETLPSDIFTLNVFMPYQ